MDAAVVDAREVKGREIAKTTRLKRVAGHWVVPSSTGKGTYVVDPEKGFCSCPDHEIRQVKCKHLIAVEYVRHQRTEPDGSETVTETMRVTYSQDWPKYRAARRMEKKLFQKLLHSLCSGIVQPTYKGNGRPALPLADVIFSGALKVYDTFSMDRTMSDIDWAKERDLIAVVPHPNTVLRVMRDPQIVPVLRQLIEESTKPLRLVEVDFAADGTGIATKTYVRWYDNKYGKERKEKKWISLKAMVGVKTLIVTAAEVVHGTANDSPWMQNLVATTAKTFNMSEVSGDAGFSSKANLQAIRKAGATPYVFFSEDATGTTRDAFWNECFALFTLNRREWLDHYHKRSLSESLFSSMKRVLGSTVRAKTFEGQVAEVYLKVLAHNLRMLVHSMFELGVDPKFWLPKPEAGQ